MPPLTAVVLRAVVGAVVRALVLVAFYAVVLGGGATSDAVGLGLLGLPVMALFALLVAGYDGWRTGLRAAWSTWVLAALLVGLGVPVWDVLVDPSSLAVQISEDTAVFGLLVLAPLSSAPRWARRRRWPRGPRTTDPDPTSSPPRGRFARRSHVRRATFTTGVRNLPVGGFPRAQRLVVSAAQQVQVPAGLTPAEFVIQRRSLSWVYSGVGALCHRICGGSPRWRPNVSDNRSNEQHGSRHREVVQR